MKRGTLIALAVGFGFALAAGSAVASGPIGKPVSSAGLAKVRAYAANAGLSKDWQDVLVLIAYRESKGNNFVGLGHEAGAPPYIDLHGGSLGESEAAAAKRAYDRNAAQYAGCWPEGVYTFGSAGWFAGIPGNMLEVFDGTPYVCLHPWTVTDPAIATTMMIGYIRRLMNWDGYKAVPTVLNIRVGVGSPSAMGDPDVLSKKRPEYEDDARKAGLSVALLDKTLAKPPLADPVALARSLGANLETWMPEA